RGRVWALVSSRGYSMIGANSGADKSQPGSGPNGVLTVALLAGTKRLPVEFLKDLGVQDLPHGGVAFPYHDPAGNELFVRQRGTRGKRFWQPPGVKLQPYGQWRLEAARKAGWLVLTEGESDAWACWYNGVPALGLPGAQAARALLPEHLEGVRT